MAICQVSMTDNPALQDLTLVDTPGVMPGQAESRGYAFVDVVGRGTDCVPDDDLHQCIQCQSLF